MEGAVIAGVAARLRSSVRVRRRGRVENGGVTRGHEEELLEAAHHQAAALAFKQVAMVFTAKCIIGDCIAAGKDFFNQDPKILQFVMENPTDRVTYGDLRMIREEFEDLMQLSIEAGTIKHPIPYATYIDERFAKATRAAAIPL